MLSPCILPTKFLRRELISAKADDNGAESEGGCEVETPNPVCVPLATPTPEPGSLRRSLLIPSPLFGLEPIDETIGGREVPGRKQSY